MDKHEHGRQLARAMAEKRLGRQAVADVVGKGPRTITNWTKGATMPDAADRAILRALFPGYDTEGDPVEVAVKASALVEWRQDAVVSFYKRNLHEQHAERPGHNESSA